MDGLAPIFIILLFLGLNFARKAKQVLRQPPNKPSIPIKKKEVWAPDSYITSVEKTPSLNGQKFPDNANLRSDRIVIKDDFRSANKRVSRFNDQSFLSMENRDLPEVSIGDQAQYIPRSSVLKQPSKPSSLILPELTPENFVKAIVMREILDRPLTSRRHRF